jgi:hypothetical protein
MKVYVVMSGFYDQYGLSQVFGTRESAEKYIQRHVKGASSWADEVQPGFYHTIEAVVGTESQESELVYL